LSIGLELGGEDGLRGIVPVYFGQATVPAFVTDAIAILVLTGLSLSLRRISLTRTLLGYADYLVAITALQSIVRIAFGRPWQGTFAPSALPFAVASAAALFLAALAARSTIHNVDIPRIRRRIVRSDDASDAFIGRRK
jgi:hypothetical protein